MVRGAFDVCSEVVPRITLKVKRIFDNGRFANSPNRFRAVLGDFFMAKTTGNARLQQARRNKKDEFYTQLSDIEEELKHYRSFFNGKKEFAPNAASTLNSKKWRATT